MAVIINLYGKSIRCWVCEIPNFRFEQLKMVADFNETALENILFDLEKLNNIGYAHWSKIFPIKELQGFKIDVTNKIEIKIRTRLISKFTTEKILGNNLLFSLYNTNRVKLNVKLREGFKYILVGQKEIGNIKYKIPINNFSIDALNFMIYSGINMEENIVAFSYKKKLLHPISSDTIVQSFFTSYIGIKGD